MMKERQKIYKAEQWHCYSCSSITFYFLIYNEMANNFNLGQARRQIRRQPHPSERPPLTFGVEIELVLGFLAPNDQDPHPLDPRAGYGVLSELADGAKDRRNYWSVTPEYITSEAYRDLTITLQHADIPVYVQGSSSDESEELKCWCMEDDPSIQRPTGSDSDNYTWVRVEIKSPALYVTTEAFEQVAAVCELLSSNYRVCTHQETSAGLHVHVGQENNGFHIEALRNLLSTIWIFQGQLETVHPDHRLSTRWAPSLRTDSVLAKKIVDDGLAKEQVLELLSQAGDESSDPSKLINIAADREQLLKLFLPRGARRLAYNINGLLQIVDGKDGRSTIEFRQHESTIDIQRVINWLKVCVGLVEFAYAVDFRVLGLFLEAHLGDTTEEFNIVHVLKAVGLPPQMLFYGSSLG